MQTSGSPAALGFPSGSWRCVVPSRRPASDSYRQARPRAGTGRRAHAVLLFASSPRPPRGPVWMIGRLPARGVPANDVDVVYAQPTRPREHTPAQFRTTQACEPTLPPPCPGAASVTASALRTLQCTKETSPPFPRLLLVLRRRPLPRIRTRSSPLRRLARPPPRAGGAW